MGESRRIYLGAAPARMQYFEPSLFFQRMKDVQRVILVCHLLDFAPDCFIGDVLDVVILPGRIKTRLGALFERPVEAGCKAGGADQAGGIFNECVVVQNANQLGLDISCAVEWVHEQAAGARIQRQRHSIYSEIAAAQIFNDGRGRNERRLAGLLVSLCARHADFGANVPRQGYVEHLQVIIGGRDDCLGALQFLLQLEGIALNSEIEIADGKPADDVAHGAAGEIYVHTRGAGDVLDQRDAFLLVRRQPDFHGVDVISHSLQLPVALSAGRDSPTALRCKISTGVCLEKAKGMRHSNVSDSSQET